MTSRSRSSKRALVARQRARILEVRSWGGLRPTSYDYMKGYEKNRIRAMMMQCEVGRYEGVRFYESKPRYL